MYTKEELINKLVEIKNSGWIRNARFGNVGGIGNTLEDLLGITENNLPIPNASEWELKCQRLNTSSLTTLFHIEPSPRALKFVPEVLLPKYGWKHKEASKKYSDAEMSFRQTIHGKSRSDRGFMVIINRKERKVLISFDANHVSEKHSLWLNSVKERVGLKELDPQPYWGFDDLFHKAGTKLLNCFYVQAQSKREKEIEYFKYDNILMLQKFSLDRFLEALEQGDILIDFDARTGHNHGTKFRLRQDKLSFLYETVTVIS
ncbi:MAG: MvaI/BcnI restriction endonuclease family protein [Nitrospirae bacterium]|nr:MvaI/BcnI restriction endonuclease family protein [Nitrospirota bacterium]